MRYKDLICSEDNLTIELFNFVVLDGVHRAQVVL